jgi:predicted nuclease with TOPRIM domain
MKRLIIEILIISSLTGLVYVLKNELSETKEQLEKTTTNFKQLESDNYTLELSKKELTDYIGDLNTQFKQEIDSVTKAHDIKLKDIKQLVNNKTVVSIIDTVFMPAEEVKVENDSLYKLKFTVDSACYKAVIYALTKDQSTTVNLHELETENNSYYIVHYEKKPWWRLFKKRKLLITTVNDCGTSETKVINITK